MKVVLLGYMGCGKSSVGKMLADRLKINFIDLDLYIEEKEAMPISEIFSSKGEIYFRCKETDYLNELLTSDKSMILSVGGGTPCYANNMDNIVKKSTSIYLNTSLNSLYNRLKRQRKSRPLIATIKLENLKEFIAKHLFERKFYYNQASLDVKTDDKTVLEVVNVIKNLL